MRNEEKDFQRLTIEEVRKVKGFELKSDEEIEMIIITVERISNLIYKKLNITKSVYE
jgi:hypothetical protein